MQDFTHQGLGVGGGFKLHVALPTAGDVLLFFFVTNRIGGR